MKKISMLIVAICVMALAVSCEKKTQAASSAQGAVDNKTFGKAYGDIGVALIINTNLGDKSFCDLSKQGLMEASEKYGFKTKIVELGGDATKQIPTLTEFAEDPAYDIIVCGTPNIKEAVQDVASEFPDQKFILYDTKEDKQLPNVYSVEHLQNTGSFIVGAAAAMLTSSDAPLANKEKIVGFVAGGENTAINDFLVGYIQGVKTIDPQCRVLISYIGDFRDSAKAKEMAISQINLGADVVFQVAGGAGLGVLEGCAEKNVYSIGVDSDQYVVLKDSAPNIASHIATSMQKKVSRTVFNALSAAMEDKLPWGQYDTTGLAQGSVGAARNENFASIFTSEQIKQLDVLEQKVISGEITVQSAIGMDNKVLNEIKESARR
jgi:basic membrane protein A